MSKNVAILEGTTGKQFSGVKKIQLNNIEGGSSYWVPEDETKLGTKHITEDGEYIASQETDEGGTSKGWYGYEKVTVSGIGKASGIDPDTGEEAVVDTNPETGELTKTIVPSTIGFAHPPNKRAYEDGERITLLGAVVRAYLNSGGDWEDEDHPSGIVPLTELTLDPTTADISQVTEKSATSPLLPEGTSLLFSEQKIIKQFRDGEERQSWIASDDAEISFANKVEGTDERMDIVFASHSPFLVTSPGYSQPWSSSPYTYDGETVHVFWVNIPFGGVWGNELNVPINDINLSNNILGFVSIYGDVTGGGQSITVKWNRPEDGKELTTTFDIVVYENDDGDD